MLQIDKRDELPRVSVIINHFTQMECSPSAKFPYFSYSPPIRGCVESVEAQDYKNKEILLADREDGNGAGAIRNEAIGRATGEILFFICGDAIMASNQCLSKLVSVFKKTNADVVVGSSLPTRQLAPLFIYLLELEYTRREKDMGEGYVDAGATTYLAIKRDVLNEVGGFPTKSACLDSGNRYFDSGFADWDFCGELREKDHRIWHTLEVQFYHIYQTDFFSYFKKQFLQAWYRVAYLRRFKRVREGYTTLRMTVQPALWGALPVWFLLGWVFSPAWYKVAYLNIALIFLWDTGSVLNFYRETKDLKVFLLLPVSFFRSLMWALGILVGTYDFYIKPSFMNLLRIK